MRIRRLRDRRLSRLRYGRKFISWLNIQSARLGITPDTLFNKLKSGETSAQIEDTPTPAPPTSTTSTTTTTPTEGGTGT